ncbi:hypothetical protein VPH35_109850 [Triticum aestivum]
MSVAAGHGRGHVPLPLPLEGRSSRPRSGEKELRDGELLQEQGDHVLQEHDVDDKLEAPSGDLNEEKGGSWMRVKTTPESPCCPLTTQPAPHDLQDGGGAAVGPSC